MTDHTPTPWRSMSAQSAPRRRSKGVNYPAAAYFIFHGEPDTGEYYRIATTTDGFQRAKADADLIVCAVNSHHPLLAMAIKVQAAMKDLSESNPGFLGKLTLQDYAQWNEAFSELPRAIRLATGKASQT